MRGFPGISRIVHNVPRPSMLFPVFNRVPIGPRVCHIPKTPVTNTMLRGGVLGEEKGNNRGDTAFHDTKAILVSNCSGCVPDALKGLVAGACQAPAITVPALRALLSTFAFNCIGQRRRSSGFGKPVKCATDDTEPCLAGTKAGPEGRHNSCRRRHKTAKGQAFLVL